MRPGSNFPKEFAKALTELSLRERKAELHHAAQGLPWWKRWLALWLSRHARRRASQVPVCTMVYGRAQMCVKDRGHGGRCG